MNIIKDEDFNVNKLAFLPCKELKEHYTRYIFLPQYDYGNGKNSCIFLTSPIKIRYGGIPKIDEHRLTDNNCLFFWLNLDQCEGGKDLRDTVFRPIDKLADKKINKEGNKDFIVRQVETGEKIPLKKLRYFPVIKISNPDYKIVYERVKVNLDIPFIEGIDLNAPRKIKTAVFLPVDMTKPVNERVFKKKPEVITCLDDIRKIFYRGCLVQFTLQINKMWVHKKTLSKGERECGITIKCLQMFILDIPPKKHKITNSILPTNFIKFEGNDDEEDDNVKKVQKKLAI